MTDATLITLSPAAGELGHLLRMAIDAEQVGASRIHLPADLPDAAHLILALRQSTSLVITADADHPAAHAVDELPGPAVDVVIDPGPSSAELVATVARTVAEAPADTLVSIAGRGAAGLPVLLAALAAGAHVLVGTAYTPPDTSAGDASADPRGDARPPGKDDAALVARASGLARIAGRRPLEGRAARRCWRVE